MNRLPLVLLPLLLPLLGAPPATAEDDPAGGWPLDPQPRVVERFDPPDSPYGAGHRGVDLAGEVGQRVGTALPGTVTWAGPLAGRGVIVVDHGETRTTYEPVTASVGVGDVLPAGAAIGTLDLPRSHCFPDACLHWGWIRNADGVYLDPLRLVGEPGPIRLLPLWRDLPTRSERPSGAGMGLLIGTAQPIGGDVGVALGGRQRGVAEKFLHRPQVGAPFEQVGRGRMP